MFGWRKNANTAVVESVALKLRPLFELVEIRLRHFPLSLAQDPFIVGYVVGAATIISQIETSGRADTELRGRACIAGIVAAFAPLNFGLQEASAAMLKIVGDPEAKRGSRAADLIIGVMLGMHDRDSEPEILAAKDAVSAMPESIKRALGGTPQSLLVSELQERLFFEPIEAKHRDA